MRSRSASVRRCRGNALQVILHVRHACSHAYQQQEEEQEEEQQRADNAADGPHGRQHYGEIHSSRGGRKQLLSD